MTGNDLGNGSPGSLTGTNLLTHVPNITMEVNGGKGYLIAYQAGNAYIYYGLELDLTPNQSLQAGEIQLVATIEGIAVGALELANFTFTL